MANAKIWKTEEKKYSVQFSNVEPKERKTILNMFSTWREVGTGFHSDGTQLFIFSKQYGEEQHLREFLKTIPFPLIEEGKSGKIKNIKTRAPLTSSSKRAKIREGRTCSKCGIKGHNSRTCKK
jgi:hypothetical protein